MHSAPPHVYRTVLHPRLFVSPLEHTTRLPQPACKSTMPPTEHAYSRTRTAFRTYDRRPIHPHLPTHRQPFRHSILPEHRATNTHTRLTGASQLALSAQPPYTAFPALQNPLTPAAPRPGPHSTRRSTFAPASPSPRIASRPVLSSQPVRFAHPPRPPSPPHPHQFSP